MAAAAAVEMAAGAAATVAVVAESGTAQFTAPHSQINHALTTQWETQSGPPCHTSATASKQQSSNEVHLDQHADSRKPV